MRLPDVLPVVHFNRTTPYRQPEWIFPGLRAGQVGLLTAPGGTGAARVAGVRARVTFSVSAAATGACGGFARPCGSIQRVTAGAWACAEAVIKKLKSMEPQANPAAACFLLNMEAPP